MAADTDSEMKVSTANNSTVNVDNYRRLVQNYLRLHLYQAALFWADKVVALGGGKAKDIYWLAHCMFLLKQYHRAAHLLKTHNLEKTYVMCNYLTVRCYLEANELNEALQTLNLIDVDTFTCTGAPQTSALENEAFDDTPKAQQVKAALLLLKGKILEAMDNRGLAADCFKEALKHDVYCYEALDALIKHQMLSVDEEEEVINSLPITEQCAKHDAEVLQTLYDCKRKKYHTTLPPQKLINGKEIVKKIGNIANSTPHSGLILGTSTPASISVTPNFPKTDAKDQEMNVEAVENPLLVRLQDSLDLAVSEAERLYYNCDYQQCHALTELILKQDPYHYDCLPIHISCEVELKKNNKLFALAHNLVDLYPDIAISWYAVGCYYYVIGKSDSARKYLAKATCLDRLFGPAWLAYGHSFAVENEHDQAMAAYFKAAQLMKGCHLPLLYIGLECGLTNNVRLAMKFFVQAQRIAANDPFVMHEMGVIAFQNLDYESAEKFFKSAFDQLVKVTGLPLPQRWEPLLNNLGHTCRKLKKYDMALEYHQQALILSPQSAGIYSAIAYVHALMEQTEEAVEWFHKALGLRRDDTFSTTMLNYVIQQLSEEQPAFPGAPDNIPNFLKEEEEHPSQESASQVATATNPSMVELSDMSMSM